MTNVKMRAIDTLHVSSAGPDNIAPGGEFQVTEAVARELEDKGLAKRVGGAKAEKAPANKAEPAPANKTISADAFDHDGNGVPGGSRKGPASTRARGAAKKGK